MTRSQALTLSRLKQHASHVHPGQVGRCDSWSCPEFLEVIGPLFEPIVTVPATTLTQADYGALFEPKSVVCAEPVVEKKKSKGKK